MLLHPAEEVVVMVTVFPTCKVANVDPWSGDEDVIGGHPHRIRGLRYQLEFSCRVDSGGTGGGTVVGLVVDWCGTGGGLVVDCVGLVVAIDLMNS